MKTALIIFAIVGAVVCRGPFDIFGGKRGPGGRRGSEERDGRSPLPQGPPPYLRNVTSEARREYFEIARNMTLTIAEQKQEILEWAKKYNVEDEVEAFNEDIAKLIDEIKQNVTDLISELEEANKKIGALLENEDQTPIELFQAIHNLTQENPPVYAVLKFASEQFLKKPHGPHPRRGNSGEGRSLFGSSEEHGPLGDLRNDDNEQQFGGFRQNGGPGIGKGVFIGNEQNGRGFRGNSNFRV